MKKKFLISQKTELISFLLEHTDYSRKKLKSMISHQQILVDEQPVKLPMLLEIGSHVSIQTEKKIAHSFPILYEDDRFLVVDKPSGLLCVSNGKNEDTLYRQVYQYLHEKKEKVFIVHRLDKDTSGIVLFAKTEEVKNILQEHWNTIVKQRKYVAIVKGTCPKQGTIQSYLQENNTFVYSARTGKLAITNYCVKKTNGKYSLLDIDLKTGRKNQIRVHMKENGTPILGDRKYGKANDFPRLALHAYLLSFVYPIDQKIYTFQTQIPEEFEKFFY